MNAQIKFSDVIRFVILGGFALAYFFILANLFDIPINFGLLQGKNQHTEATTEANPQSSEAAPDAETPNSEAAPGAKTPSSDTTLEANQQSSEAAPDAETPSSEAAPGAKTPSSDTTLDTTFFIRIASLLLIVLLLASLFLGMLIQFFRLYVEDIVIRTDRILINLSKRSRIIVCVLTVTAAIVLSVILNSYLPENKIVLLFLFGIPVLMSILLLCKPALASLSMGASIFGSTYQACLWVKNRGIYKQDMPIWIYLTERPDKTLDFVRGRISKNVEREDLNSLNESYYYHELFMGTSFVLLLVPAIIFAISAGTREGIGSKICVIIAAIEVIYLLISGVHIFANKLHNFWWKRFWQTLCIAVPIALLACGYFYELLTTRTLGILSITFFATILLRKIANMHALNFIKLINTHYDFIEDYREKKQTYIVEHIPYVYALIRTHDFDKRLDYITRAVESVLDQNYPNKRIIIFDDVPENKQATEDDLIKSIEEKLHSKHGEKPPHIDNLKKICIYKKGSTHLGPSGASIEIREAFLNEANRRDIALLLDADDYLDRTDAFLEIAVKLHATKAKMCLTTFRNVECMGNVLSNAGGKYHNDKVREIAKRNYAIRYCKDLIFTDTLGWTKVYSYELLERYLQNIKNYDNEDEGPTFNQIPAFEDFPDFICYLFKDTTITAVERPVHCYFKHGNSITDLNNKNPEDAFKQRAQFLAYTIGIIQYLHKETGSVRKNAIAETEAFIAYKIGVICNIILTKQLSKNSVDSKSANIDTIIFQFLEYIYSALNSETTDKRVLIHNIYARTNILTSVINGTPKSENKAPDLFNTFLNYCTGTNRAKITKQTGHLRNIFTKEEKGSSWLVCTIHKYIKDKVISIEDDKFKEIKHRLEKHIDKLC